MKTLSVAIFIFKFYHPRKLELINLIATLHTNHTQENDNLFY